MLGCRVVLESRLGICERTKSKDPFVRIHGLKLVLHLTRLNKVFNYKQKDFRLGENRELECVGPTYLGNWKRIYAEFLLYIMVILSDTDFVVF